MVPRIKNILLFLLAIIPYIYLTNRLFLLEPPVWPDEAVFTDVAKTFIRTGHIATQIYGGAIYNTAAHFYFYPPAYFLTLSAWIRMFGPGIESVRLMSSFIGLLSLVLFWIYIVRLFHSRTLAVAGTVMLSIDSYFGLSSRTARMEIVVFFLFISTLIVIDIAFQRKSALWYLAGGILASCAVMTHPLGIMVVALAVFAVIARHRKIDTDVCWDLLPPALAAAGWFISMGKNFPMFIYQVGINFAYKNAEVPHIFTLFGQGIFWQISMVCIGLIIAIQTLVVIQKRKYSDIFVLGGFVISVLFVLWGKVFWYTIYPAPFIDLMILGFFACPPKQNVYRYGVFLLSFCTILAQAAILYMTLQSFQGMDNGYHLFTRSIQSFVPRGGHVLLASVWDPYFDLKRDSGLTLYELSELPLPDSDIKPLLDNADVVIYTNIFSPYVASYLNTYRKSTIQIHYGYSATVVLLLPRGERFAK